MSDTDGHQDSSAGDVQGHENGSNFQLDRAEFEMIKQRLQHCESFEKLISEKDENIRSLQERIDRLEKTAADTVTKMGELTKIVSLLNESNTPDSENIKKIEELDTDLKKLQGVSQKVTEQENIVEQGSNKLKNLEVVIKQAEKSLLDRINELEKAATSNVDDDEFMKKTESLNGKLQEGLKDQYEKFQKELKDQCESLNQKQKDLGGKMQQGLKDQYGKFQKELNDQCESLKKKQKDLDEKLQQGLKDQHEKLQQEVQDQAKKLSLRATEREDGRDKGNKNIEDARKVPRKDVEDSETMVSVEPTLKQNKKRIDEMSATILKLMNKREEIKQKFEEFKKERTDSDNEKWKKMIDLHNQLEVKINERLGTVEGSMLERLEKRLEEQRCDVERSIDNKVQQASRELGSEMNEKDVAMKNELLKCSQMEEKIMNKVKAKLSDVKADLRNQVTKLKDLKERCKLSQTEQSEKMEQKISEIESQRNQREELLVNDFDNKFGQLKREMAEGDAVIMNNLKLLSGELNNDRKQVAVRLNTFESKMVKTLKEDKEELDKRLKEIETNREQRESNMIRDMDMKVSILRSDITEHAESITRNLEFINYLNSSLCQMHPRLETVENIQRLPAVGFTARSLGYQLNCRSPVMKGFREIVCNDGGHYNAATGIFTAPRAGLYVASLTHTQSENGEINLALVHSKGGPAGAKTCVAYTWTYGQHCSCSESALVKMEAGDMIYIQIQHFTGNGHIWSPSSFSCFLIG